MSGNVFLEILSIEINFDTKNNIPEIEAHRNALLAQIEILINSPTQNISLASLTKQYPGIPAVLFKKKQQIDEDAQKRLKEITDAEQLIAQAIKAIGSFKVDYSDKLTTIEIEIQCQLLLDQLEALSYSDENIKNAITVLNLTMAHQDLAAVVKKKKNEIKFLATLRVFSLSAVTIEHSETDENRYRLTKKDIEILIENKKKKKELNCYVIEGEKPLSLDLFFENIAKSGATRTQLIFKVSGTEHWSAMDIHRDKEGKLKIFFIDAAGSYYNQPAVLALCRKEKIEVTFCMDGLQKDFFSCSIFSVDHAFHMSKIPDLHEQIDRVKVKSSILDYVSTVAPIDLPPVLVKNVQFKDFLEQYLAKNKKYETVKINKKGQTLREYIESHKNIEEMDAIEYKQKKYREKINSFIQNQTRSHQLALAVLEAKQVVASVLKAIQNIEISFEDQNTASKIELHSIGLLKQLEDKLLGTGLDKACKVLGIKGQHPDISKALHEQQMKINQYADIQRRQNILIDINFDKYLKIFRTKSIEIRKYRVDAVYFQYAAEKAKDLYLALNAAKKHFLLEDLDKSIDQSKHTFSTKCRLAINAAKPSLDSHRGWNTAFRVFNEKILLQLTVGQNENRFVLFPKIKSAKQSDGHEHVCCRLGRDLMVLP